MAAVKKTARKGIIDERGGVFGTGKILGYVCAIHGDDDKDEELRGTVDVQEYNCYEEDNNHQAIGFHEGVMLSAVQGNTDGFRIVPQMYSDVVISTDPTTMKEYVVMYSHISKMQVKSTDSIEHTVTEYEDFSETSEGGLDKDYDELDRTGNGSTVSQSCSEINHTVGSKDGSSKVKQTPVLHSEEAKKITHNGDKYHHVKSETLEDILKQLLDLLATATAAGSPLSTAAAIRALENQLKEIESDSVYLGH